MGWIDKFRKVRKGQPSRYWDTVRANDQWRDELAGRGERPTDGVAPLSANVADDIKRRQVSLIVRYVMSVRAR